MRDLLPEATWSDWSSAAGVLTAALALFVWLRRKWVQAVRPRLRMFDEAMILLQGRPPITLPEDPGHILSPGLPGAVQRLSAIEETQAIQAAVLEVQASALEAVQGDVALVRNELTTNGGSSLRDAITRIEESLAS